MIDKIELNLLFKYVDGTLYWRGDAFKHKNKGKRAGCLHHTGYRIVRVARTNLLEHRIVFLMHHGWLPKIIDHINGIKDDNRIENLRACTCSQNGMNAQLCTNNTSGCTGVVWSAKAGKWQAQIKIKGKLLYLGQWLTKFDAVCARRSAEHKYFGAFAPNIGVIKDEH